MFKFPSQKKEGKGGWEPSFASNLILNFRVLIQPYSSRLVNNFCWGGWALLSVSKLERQRTSGSQKRTRSEFIYRAQGYRSRSRKLGLPLSAALIKVKETGPIDKYFWQAKNIQNLCNFKGKAHCMCEHFHIFSPKGSFCFSYLHPLQ